MRWWTGKICGDEGAKALTLMLLMQVPLTTLDLSRKTATLLDMVLKGQKMTRLMVVLSSEQDWSRRSKSPERCIEDKHNTPITESVV